MIDAEGTAQGVILLISTEFGNGWRTNLSSWYVRHIIASIHLFLLQQALRSGAETFLELTPAPHVVPIMKGLGFKAYTGD